MYIANYFSRYLMEMELFMNREFLVLTIGILLKLQRLSIFLFKSGCDSEVFDCIGVSQVQYQHRQYNVLSRKFSGI